MVALGLAVAAGACSPGKTPTVEPQDVAASASSAAETVPDPQPLYDRMDTAQAAFEEGIELILGGEEVLGEERLTVASNDLDAAAAECIETAGCDVGRFIETLDVLLGQQAIALKQQTSRLGDIEAGLEEDVEREPGTSPFVSAMPEIGETVSLLHGMDLREIIEINGPVNAALDDWLTWMRPMLMDAYRNYQFLREDIAPIYESAGLPEALLFAMIATETGGKVHSYSRAGAAGPLQFMRHTGRRYGLKEVDGFDTRLDPVSATHAAVAYLNDQFAVLNNSLEKALGAYNGGENRMASLHRRLGGASFWDKRLYWSLPSETREYVPRILAAAWLFLHPEDYSLELPDIDTTRATLTVREPIALGELSICLGQVYNDDGWFRTLRNLNPRLEPGERVDAGAELIVPAALVPVYGERCLSGELIAGARVLHDANYPEGPQIIPYVVRRGDTLGKIASRHKCATIGQIAEINGIRAPRYVIHVGQNLKVPTCG